MEINGILLGIYSNGIIQVVYKNLFESFEQIWKNAIEDTKDVQEMMYCVCFFNDLLEFSEIEVKLISKK